MKKNLPKIILVIVFFGLGIALVWAFQNATQTEDINGVTAPKEVNEIILMADNAYKNGEFSKAITLYKEAEQKAPDDPMIRIRSAQVYQSKNRYSDAEQELLYANELDSKNPDITFRLASIYLMMSDYEDARTFADKTLELVDGNFEGRAETLLTKATAEVWLSEFEDASSTIQEAYNLKTDNDRITYLYGILASRGDLITAKDVFLRIPDGSELISKAAAAIQGIEYLLSFDGDADQRTIQTGVFYLEQGFSTISVEYFESVRAQNPNYHSATYYLGYAFLQMGDIASAEQMLTLAITQIDVPDAISYFYLGELYSAQNLFDKAVEAYQMAIELGDLDPTTFYHLGRALSYEDDLIRAQKAYERSLEIDPTSLQVRTSLIALLIHSLKAPADAITVAEAGLNLYPDTPEYLSLLGWAELESGDLVHAETHLRKALKIDPNLAAAHLNIAIILENKELIEDAISEYQAALELDFKGDIAPLADAALQRLTQ